jgi:hypothetical protein
MVPIHPFQTASFNPSSKALIRAVLDGEMVGYYPFSDLFLGVFSVKGNRWILLQQARESTWSLGYPLPAEYGADHGAAAREFFARWDRTREHWMQEHRVS